MLYKLCFALELTYAIRKSFAIHSFCVEQVVSYGNIKLSECSKPEIPKNIYCVICQCFMGGVADIYASSAKLLLIISLV